MGYHACTWRQLQLGILATVCMTVHGTLDTEEPKPIFGWAKTESELETFCIHFYYGTVSYPKFGDCMSMKEKLIMRIYRFYQVASVLHSIVLVNSPLPLSVNAKVSANICTCFGTIKQINRFWSWLIEQIRLSKCDNLQCTNDNRNQYICMHVAWASHV